MISFVTPMFGAAKWERRRNGFPTELLITSTDISEELGAGTKLLSETRLV